MKPNRIRLFLPLLLTITVLAAWPILHYVTRAQFVKEQTEMLHIHLDELTSAIENRLRPDRDFIVLLASEWRRGNLDSETFRARGARYIQDNPGLNNLVLADADFIIEDVTPFADNKQIVGLGLTLPEPKRASRQAYREHRGIYTKPFTIIQGKPGFEIYYPVFSDERFLGIISGVYDAQRLLDASAHHHISFRYGMFLVTAEGNRFATVTREDELLDSEVSGIAQIPMVQGSFSVEMTGYKTALSIGTTFLIALLITLGTCVIYLIWAQLREVDARKKAEEEALHLATHDNLTGLANRNLLADLIDLTLENAKRNSSSFAVLFLDVDDLKGVNDSMGHHVGDQLLRDIGLRIKSCLRAADTVSRYGGDEFVILLNQVDSEHAEAVARKIIRSFDNPFPLDNSKVQSGCSIGIALFPDNGLTDDELIGRADNAMYQAKERGKLQYCVSRVIGERDLTNGKKRDVS